MALPQTITRTHPSYGNNLMPVLCNDALLGCATVSTDLIMQPSNLASYAGAVLPAGGAALGTMLNLARNVQPFISRTGAVTAAPSDGANPPTFDAATGAVFAPATKLPLAISKVGVAANVICSPSTEGFIDFLIQVFFRATALPASQAGIFCCGYSGGRDWGIMLNQSAGGGGIKEMITGAGLNSGSTPLATLQHAGVLYRFNVGANTSMLRTYYQGALVASGIAGQAPTAYAGATGNRKCLVGGGNGYAVLTGAVARWSRDYVGLAGFTDAQVDALVAREYAAGLAAGL